MKKLLLIMNMLFVVSNSYSQLRNDSLQNGSDSGIFSGKLFDNKTKSGLRWKLQDITSNSAFLTTLSSISFSSSAGETDLTGNISYSPSLNDILNLTIKTPFGKSSKTEPVTLDGLSNKTSIALTWSHDFWEVAKIKYYDSDLIKTFKKINDDREKICCDDSVKIAEDVNDLSKDEKELFYQLIEYRMMLPFCGIKIKTAKSDYDYLLDSTNMITETKSKYDIEFKAFGGLRITNHKNVALSLTYQRYYDGGDMVSYSIPLINGIEKHMDLNETKPILKNKLNIQMEYRGINRSSTFAYNPYLLIDLVKKKAEFKTLLYFFKQKDSEGAFKGLNGGFFAGYRTSDEYKLDSKTSNILLGLFFTAPFDINKY